MRIPARFTAQCDLISDRMTSLFIRTHNEPLSAAMCVSDPDRSPLKIHR